MDAAVMLRNLAMCCNLSHDPSLPRYKESVLKNSWLLVGWNLRAGQGQRVSHKHRTGAKLKTHQ